MVRRSVVSLVVCLLVGSVAGAENLVSGPQVGDQVPGEFRVLFLNGVCAGETGSPISAKGNAPVALLFVNDVSDNLTPLIKRIEKLLDGAVARTTGNDVPSVFVVVTSDDVRVNERFKDMIAKE